MKHLMVGVIAFGMAFFCGCTKNIGCALETNLVTGVTPLIASQLQCSNPTAIQADLTDMVAGLNLCRPVQSDGKLHMPQPICSMMADLVLGGVAKVAIPNSWGCTAANAKQILKSVIVNACSGV